MGTTDGREFADLLLAWPVALIEKVSFFEDYLAEARAEAPQTYISVLESLEDRLHRLRDELAIATFTLKRVNAAATLSEAELENHFLRLVSLCNKFIAAHAGVRWTYTPWAEEETYSLLRSLFASPGQRRTYEELRPTILFTSQFNFLHKAFEDSANSVLAPRTRGALLILPKTSKYDCFVWPLLAHELAHGIYQTSHIEAAAAPEVLKLTPAPRNKQVLSWMEELACDLIALRLFGPAYFCALAEHLLFFNTGQIRKFSDTHIAPLYRLELLLDILLDDYRSSNPNFTTSPFPELEFWQRVLHARAYFQRRMDEKLLGEIQQDTELFEKLVRKMTRILLTRMPGLPCFSYEQCTESVSLIQGLRSGITVGSSRSPGSFSKVLDILASGEAAARFDEICAHVNERPNTPATILNAGWILKTREYCAPSERERLYARGVSKDELAALGRRFRERAWRIQKSIETSLIHSFYLQTGT